MFKTITFGAIIFGGSLAMQLWSHRVHQLVLLRQWFAGWRYDFVTAGCAIAWGRR
jgi:hypothetical protein